MRHPKALMPLVHAIESYEDTVKHLQTVLDGLLEDIENGDTPTLTESDKAELLSALNWAQTGSKYAKEFEGGISNESTTDFS